MYLHFLWRSSSVRCQVRNVQWIPRFYASQKVLTKPQNTKLDLSEEDKATEIDVKNKNEFSLTKSTSVVPDSRILENQLGLKKGKTNSDEWNVIQLDTSKLGIYYLKLSKYRLTSLVVITSMVGYAMAPAPFNVISFLSCTVGTGLVSSAANSVNQFLEIPFDAQMTRTRNRVLVQGQLTPLHALGFAVASGCVGLLILYLGANSLTAALGASNLLLYTVIYTPLKRISILNTWVGSIVGAIPPLMGWAACQGTLDLGAITLGGILYAWQFPHFNALSWNLRPDYSKAGYRMMAVTNPGLCRRTALRYTLGITVCSSLAPILNVTHWSFGVLSLPINFYFAYLAYNFFKESDSKNSRKLFRFSLLHLPLLLSLMLLTKQGFLFPLNQTEKKDDKLDSYKKTEEGSNSFLRQLSPADNKQFSNSQVLQVSV